MNVNQHSTIYHTLIYNVKVNMIGIWWEVTQEAQLHGILNVIFGGM